MKKVFSSCYKRIPGVRELIALAKSMTHLQNTLESLRQVQALQFIASEQKNNPRFREEGRLLAHASQVCSQSGEDGIIREIFRRIGTVSRSFVEVGVGDGTENNTAFLLAQGWKGHWFDGSDASVRKLEKSRNRSKAENQLAIHVGLVTKDNIAELFRKTGVPDEVDLFSLDIDQNTYFIWKALTGFRPRVVVVEYNAMFPADAEWIPEDEPFRVWDGTHNFGASLKSLEKLGTELGYSLVGCEFAGLNAFFVRNDLLQNHFNAPYTSENHYEAPRYSLSGCIGHPKGILDWTGR